ncbi:uncharacterized protein METZ01_LOCUS111938, partial [marine metagenome]
MSFSNFIPHTVLKLLITIVCLLSRSVAYDIRHLEPPFWWVGMVESKLQLMVHGENISDLQPEIDHEGIEIDEIHRSENKNYIFIDLSLTKVKPGSFDIIFKHSGKIEAKYQYDLFERKSGSMERHGFDPSDVIYLITPDRFANGDPSNDTVLSLKESS